MEITKNGLTFTSGERVVLAMACSWDGLRRITDRTGFWSQKNLEGMPNSFEKTAERLLMRFGDLKMVPKEISKICAWAMNDIDSEVYRR